MTRLWRLVDHVLPHSSVVDALDAHREPVRAVILAGLFPEPPGGPRGSATDLSSVPSDQIMTIDNVTYRWDGRRVMRYVPVDLTLPDDVKLSVTESGHYSVYVEGTRRPVRIPDAFTFAIRHALQHAIHQTCDVGACFVRH